MPLKKLSEIEEKLNKDYLNIKNRYIKIFICINYLTRCATQR